MDGLKYLLGLGKPPELITINLMGNTTGFTFQNNHTLSFRVTKGSTVQMLLDQFNKYRGPDTQVNILYDIHNNALSQRDQLQESRTLYLEPKPAR